MKPLVLIGADHGGVVLKGQIKACLDKQGYDLRDLGAHGPDPVDYPDIAFLVARGVAEARESPVTHRLSSPAATL